VGWSSTGHAFHTRAMASLQEVRSCISSKVRLARIPTVVSVHRAEDRALASHPYRKVEGLSQLGQACKTSVFPQQDASTI
jgi:hypothetical protein